MPVVDPDNIRSFETAQAFYDWLRDAHDQRPELWLKFFKKGSGLATVDVVEAVRVALCWGWIDGQKRGFDETAYLIRFTPRRKGSKWSARNVEHVAELERSGLMQPAGRAQVEAAKADGRWHEAYSGQRDMELPEDFKAQLDANPAAKAFFETLPRSEVFSVYYRLHNAKEPEMRAKKIREFLVRLENRQMPVPRK